FHSFYTPVSKGVGYTLRGLQEVADVPFEFYRAAVREENRAQVFATIGGALLVGAGVGLTVATGGLGTPLGAAIAGTGIGALTAAGAGAVVGGAVGYELSNVVMDVTGDANTYWPLEWGNQGEDQYRRSTLRHGADQIGTEWPSSVTGMLAELAADVDGDDRPAPGGVDVGTELVVSAGGGKDFVHAPRTLLAPDS